MNAQKEFLNRLRTAGKFDAKAPATFSEVDSAAWGCVGSLVAAATKSGVCFICKDVRAQEDLVTQLTDWLPSVRAVPDVEPPKEDEVVLPDPEVMAERLEILQLLASGEKIAALVVTESQWSAEVPSTSFLKKNQRVLNVGDSVDPEALIAELTKQGYEAVPQVFSRGQFSLRGGILDIFSWQQRLPVRVEFFGDEIESLREFDLDRQVSVGKIDRCELVFHKRASSFCPLSDYLKKYRRVAVGDVELEADVRIHSGPSESDACTIFSADSMSFQAGDFILDEMKRRGFFSQLQQWLKADWLVGVACQNEGEWQRFSELAAGEEIGALFHREGLMDRGFICPQAKVALLTDAQIFGRGGNARLRRLAQRREHLFAGRNTSDFNEYEEGDHVVHFEHGIGRYLGLQTLPGESGEVLALEFANSARLFVPLAQAWQVTRYVGVGRRNPDLSELGDGKWEKAKIKARQSIFDYAKTMLEMQAKRETNPGHAFDPDNHWQNEFEDSFPYEETIDQLRAIRESKIDMESPRSMDRLICGDVGFGKTEVAIRATFKAVMGGKQVALLAPTTVLAQQHFQTLRERMSDYPVQIGMLSRYRTRADQNKLLAAMAEGSVDVVVGTHRLVSADVRFKNLGLLVVDEEQRFGVKHKDRMKQAFPSVDILTLSATPIPRTLYLALMGARDMSLIETPPANRQPVETKIGAYDERVIRDAVQREVDRGGQVYVLHNRVKSIEKLAMRIRELCPKAKVGVGHGQMNDDDLESIMSSFVGGKLDVLVSTTIIESGLDIPNANTILIDRADLFGLADLYQLRGRVGRSGVKAYAYLLLPRSLMMGGEAQRRVSAIKQYSDLGSGFKIAMRDLEIRGAGNLLGTAQSGHVVAVGFDLYCKLLRQAVGAIKGEKSSSRREVRLYLDFVVQQEGEDPTGKAKAFIPLAYVTDSKQRIEAYRRLNEAITEDELTQLAEEWRDRYGPRPAPVENARLIAEIRLKAGKTRISSLEVKENKLMMRRRDDYVLIGGKFPRLTALDPDSKLRETLLFLEKINL